ncbi:MAG: ATP-dependent protease, partial [Chlorobiaceae bacterium]|nr:ATP-dependent protease [Chlorobiaceae bacterium]
EKIEGFFDLCRARGLSGKHGVLIPASNIDNLMLRSDVVEAVKDGLFSVYPVTHVDEGIEILTGIPAGSPDENDRYPDNTINGMAMEKLREMAGKLRKFSSPEENEED